MIKRCGTWRATFSTPTPEGTSFHWVGDRWESAADGIKGHDFIYISGPLQFDPDGMIRQLAWENSWSLDVLG